MTVKQLEEIVCKYKHRKPFFPFLVEMKDGRIITVDNPALAINESGAVFIDGDDNFVDFDFEDVRDIRLANAEISG